MAAAAVPMYSGKANGNGPTASQDNFMDSSPNPKIQLYQRTIHTLNAEIERLKTEKQKLQLSRIPMEVGANAAKNDELFVAQMKLTELNDRIVQLQGEKSEIEKRCTTLEAQLKSAIAQKQAAEKSVDVYKDQLITAKKKIEHLESAGQRQKTGDGFIHSTSQATVTHLVALKREKISTLFRYSQQILDNFNNDFHKSVGSAFAGALGGVLAGGPIGGLVGFFGGLWVVGHAVRSQYTEDHWKSFCTIYLYLSDAKIIATEIGCSWPPAEAEPLKKWLADEDMHSSYTAIAYPLYSHTRVLLGMAPSKWNSSPIFNVYYNYQIDIISDYNERRARRVAKILLSHKPSF